MAKKTVVKEGELLPAGKDTHSGLPLNERKALECRERIETAAKNASTAFYDMSMGLLEAYENDYAKIWGYENFSDYVESALDMKYRSAYYMVEVGKVSRQFAIDRGQIERIGWTKMKEIASFIQEKPEDAKHYIEMAESMSVRQLQDSLRAEVRMTEQREARPAILRLSMKFEGEGADIVSGALTTAYADIGRDDAALAFQHIAGEWLMARGATPAAALEDWLSYLKNVYGVTLVRSESADSLDALLTGEATTSADDLALEDLLSSDRNEVADLAK